MRRLSDLSARLDKQMQMRDQRFLEVDTTEKVVARLMNWATLFAFFIGIPVAIILVGLAIYAGKGFKDLHQVAATARDSIKPVLEKARSDAEIAKRIAADALQDSTAVRRMVASMKEGLSELRTEFADRSRQAQRANEQIKESQSQVAALRAMAMKSSSEIARLNRQLQTVSNGERVAGWRDGSIDPAQKKPQDVYIALIPEGGSESGAVTTLLQNENYRVFSGGVSLYGAAGRTGQGLISIGDCSVAAVSGPPCIVYFRPELKETAARIKTLLGQVQIVPDDRVRYVDPGKLAPLAQELLQKSGLDILVVLGGR